MRKHLLRVLLAMLIFVLAMTGCSIVVETSKPDSSSSGSVIDPDTGDVYVDYVADKQPGSNQFDYDGNYSAPELTINGLADDEVWQNTSVLTTFGNGDCASVKVYRGTAALFFLFEVKDNVLLTEGETNDDAVTRSDSIEFYLDTLADGGAKPQSDDYQINLGIHGKTRIMQGAGSNWGNWNGLIDYEVAINGTLNDGTEKNDVGYTVEVMIPYSQIGIEKDDTIGVSFGQVDKYGTGATVITDWNWYGWTFDGAFREPQTIDNYVLLDKNNVLTDRDKQVKPNASLAGYVTDNNGVAVANATVSVEGNSNTWTITTDEQGYFVLADLNPEYTYSATISKDAYISTKAEWTRSELRAANGGRVLKTITLIVDDVPKTTVTGTVKNLVYGSVAGATISVADTLLSVTADENGTFSISGVPIVENSDVTLIVTAEGYAESKTYVDYETLTAWGTTDVGNVNLHLPYGVTGTFGLKSDKFANSNLKVGRALDGVEMLLSGTRLLSGHIEVYLDTKETTSAHRDNETTLWQFQLDGNGNIAAILHYKGGSATAEGLEYTLFYNTADGYSARFFIPYTYLDITPLEVFGLSLGQWSTTASDWDGWGYDGFVAPEYTNQYVRVGANNQLYKSTTNTTMVTLSGNAGVAGVKVQIGSLGSATTGSNGSWSARVASTSNEITVTYSALGYETKTTTIAAKYFDTHFEYSENVTLTKQYASISGIVTDSVTGAAISGVTVAIGETSVVTDAEGKYTLSDLWTGTDANLSFTLEGYATQTQTISASELAANTAYVYDVALVSENQVLYVTASGKITNVSHNVVGATVSIGDDVVATTAADGTFTIENFACVDSVLTIAKEGYLTQTITFKATDVSEGETAYTFATVDMPKEYQLLGNLEDKGDAKREHFVDFNAYVTKTATAYEFKLIGTRAFTNGQLEVYFHTGNSTDRGFQIVIVYDKTYRDGYNTLKGSINVVFGGSDTAPEIYLTVPYASIGVSGTDVVGFYCGMWSTSANDWDPWQYNETSIAAENWANYVRISRTGDVYTNTNNDDVVSVIGLLYSSTDTNFKNALKITSLKIDGVDCTSSNVVLNCIIISWQLQARVDSVTLEVSAEGYETATVVVYFDSNDIITNLKVILNPVEA